MNITAHNHDAVSALLTVTIDKADYKEKVEKQLHHYAKNAKIPGFRKGKVPMSLVKRQYEAPVAYEEINKVVSEGLKNYITEKKLRLVGQPVPVPVNELDYKAEQLSVQFEVGYEPNITIDLSKYEATHFQIEATDKEINQSIKNMQKRFAEQIFQDEIAENSVVHLDIAQIVEADAEGNHQHPSKKKIIGSENKKAFDLVKNLKMDESVKITKNQLLDDEDLANDLGFSKEELEKIHHEELEVKVLDFYELKEHEINQDLYDKVYGENKISSEDELRAKVKEELDEYFQQNADIHFVNKILEQITEKEDIELPETFLKKWLIFSNESIQTEEQAAEVLEKERTALKHQIIEGKLLNDYEVKLDYNDLLAQSELMVRNQLAMNGIHHLTDEEIQKYAVEMLKDEKQIREISYEVTMAKLKDVILEKASKKATKITHDEFLEEIMKNK